LKNQKEKNFMYQDITEADLPKKAPVPMMPTADIKKLRTAAQPEAAKAVAGRLEKIDPKVLAAMAHARTERGTATKSMQHGIGGGPVDLLPPAVVNDFRAALPHFIDVAAAGGYSPRRVEQNDLDDVKSGEEKPAWWHNMNEKLTEIKTKVKSIFELHIDDAALLGRHSKQIDDMHTMGQMFGYLMAALQPPKEETDVMRTAAGEINKALRGPYVDDDDDPTAETEIYGDWYKRAEKIGWDRETGMQKGWKYLEDKDGNVIETPDGELKRKQGAILEALKKEFLTIMYAQLMVHETLLKGDNKNKQKLERDAQVSKQRYEHWENEMALLKNEIIHDEYPFTRFFQLMESIIQKSALGGGAVFRKERDKHALGRKGRQEFRSQKEWDDLVQQVTQRAKDPQSSPNKYQDIVDEYVAKGASKQEINDLIRTVEAENAFKWERERTKMKESTEKTSVPLVEVDQEGPINLADRPGNPAHTFQKVYQEFVKRSELQPVTQQDYDDTKNVWFNAINTHIGHGISQKNANRVFEGVKKIENDYPDLQKRFEKLLFYGTNWLLSAMGLSSESFEMIVDDTLECLFEIDEKRLIAIISESKTLSEGKEESIAMLRELLNKAKLGDLTKYDIHNTIKKHVPAMERNTQQYEDLFDGLQSALESYGKIVA
jgi:hypothetical protein